MGWEGRDGGSLVTDRGGAMVVDRDVTLPQRRLGRWALSEDGGVVFSGVSPHAPGSSRGVLSESGPLGLSWVSALGLGWVVAPLTLVPTRRSS